MINFNPYFKQSDSAEMPFESKTYASDIVEVMYQENVLASEIEKSSGVSYSYAIPSPIVTAVYTYSSFKGWRIFGALPMPQLTSLWLVQWTMNYTSRQVSGVNLIPHALGTSL